MTLVSGSLTPTGATTDVNIDDLFSVMLDPAAYNASGSTFSTTGTIELGGTTLSLDFTSDFAIGQGIYISDSSTSAPPLLTTVVSVASLSLVIGTPASANFIGARIQHDDAAALNAAIAHGHGRLISGGSQGFYQVNGGGLAYNVSRPLIQQGGLVLENFKLIPLPSSLWVSGTLASGDIDTPPISNGVVYNPYPAAASVICRDIFIDLDTIAVNGFANYGDTDVIYENCRVLHWGGTPAETTAGIGLYNAGKCTASDCSFLQWTLGDIGPAESPVSYNSGFALFCDHVTGVSSGDSVFQGCAFNSGLRPVYIADGVNNVRFSNCHTWPCWNLATQTLASPANFEIHGTQITIDDHYLDSGNILIVQDHATLGPAVNIGIGQCVYNNSGCTPYTAHVLVTTTATNAVPGNIFISPDNLFTGAPLQPFPQQLQFGTLTGSWAVPLTEVQSAALAAQYHNLQTTKGGLLVAELGTTATVATLMGNSTIASWLRFIDGNTTASVSPQVGSEGNDIVLSYDGAVAFRGSAASGHAIIGNSTSGQTFSTHTVLNGSGSLPALQAMHTAPAHPQGYTVQFTAGAPNNKIDPAFGFQDTSSAAFKTAIWSDGSVAHPAFGFNVSEFRSLAVTSLTPAAYQIATGGAATQLAGTYELEWISSENNQQHLIVAIGYHGGDTKGLVTVLHNYFRGGSATLANPRILQDGDNAPYFVVTLSPAAAGILNVQARGYNTRITLVKAPTGLTAPATTLVNTVNQTGGGTLLSYLSESTASSNTVTNKVKVEINGTTYYLLASTSAA